MSAQTLHSSGAQCWHFVFPYFSLTFKIFFSFLPITLYAIEVQVHLVPLNSYTYFSYPDYVWQTPRNLIIKTQVSFNRQRKRFCENPMLIFSFPCSHTQKHMCMYLRYDQLQDKSSVWCSNPHKPWRWPTKHHCHCFIDLQYRLFLSKVYSFDP